MPHRVRERHCSRHPLHVTLRSALRCLRTQFVFPTLRGAIEDSRRARGESFRIVHFAVQENHVHLVVEAESARALSSGLRSLAICIARRVNRLLMRSGRVFADRWHARALTSPRAVRNAIVYVLGNFRKHGRSRPSGIDAYSSAPYFRGFAEYAGRPAAAHRAIAPRDLDSPQRAPPTSEPRTWLLAVGWKRRGLISVAEAPASA